MKILLVMQQQDSSSTLTVAYSESAWWPSGYYFGLYDQNTGEQLIEIGGRPKQVEVTLGQKLYIKATRSSIGIPDPVDGVFTIESSTGVTFTSRGGSYLKFYITGVNASFTFIYY